MYTIIAHAQTISVTIRDPLQGQELVTLITQIQTALLPVAVALASLIMIIAGYQFMTSAGDEAKRKRGMHTLLWGAIGFLILLLASVIAAGIQRLAAAPAGGP